MSFAAFEAPRLSYGEFPQMVRHAANVRLNGAEARALARKFDPEGCGEVDGPEFVRFFFRCGFEARTEERTRRWEAAYEKERERLRGVKRQMDADEAERRRTVTAPFDAEDEVKAWTKLSKVARNKGLQGDIVSRAAFESLMTPAEIKVQLKKSYNIDMTHAEMGAVCSRFDKNASGQINGAEFQYEWSHVLDGNRSKNFFGQIKEGERRSSLLAPPKLDSLELGATATAPELRSVADGDAPRRNVTRLSFSMAKIGAKSSDPGKVLRRRSSVTREQTALLLALQQQHAAQQHQPDRRLHTDRPRTSGAVPFAQRRPSSLGIPTAVAPRPLTRERSFNGTGAEGKPKKHALARAQSAPQLEKQPLHRFAATPEIPEAVARSPKAKPPARRAVAEGRALDGAAVAHRHAEDYDGDFKQMMMAAHKDQLRGRPQTTGSRDPGTGL